MKNRNFLIGLIFSLLVGGPVSLMGRNQSETIQVDKGRVILKLGKRGEESKIQVTPGEGCLAQVKITRETGKTFAQHDDKPCPSGSRFEVTIDPARSTLLLLKAGLIELPKEEKILPVLGRLEASVKAGLIETDSDKIQVQRTADYVGANARYHNPKRSGEFSLKLLVEAGTIKL